MGNRVRLVAMMGLMVFFTLGAGQCKKDPPIPIDCFNCMAEICDDGQTFVEGEGGCWCGALVDGTGVPVFTPLPGCWTPPELCFDGIDNNGDFWTDCEDFQCGETPGCECNNGCWGGQCRGGDWFEGSEHPGCSCGVHVQADGYPTSPGTVQPIPECWIGHWPDLDMCQDGTDNDEDGLIDCDDLDECGNREYCQE